MLTELPPKRRSKVRLELPNILLPSGGNLKLELLNSLVANIRYIKPLALRKAQFPYKKGKIRNFRIFWSILYDVKLNKDNVFDLKPHMEVVLLDPKNTPDMGFEVLRAAVVVKFDCQNDQQFGRSKKSEF